MSFVKWAFDNALQISIVASPLLTICLLAFWSKVPSRKEFRAATKKLHARIDLVEKGIDAEGKHMEKRVAKLEASLDDLATKDDINTVLIALEKQNGQRTTLEAKVDGMSTRIGALETPIGIIQEHLLRDRKE